jgi:hypothetical protein
MVSAHPAPTFRGSAVYADIAELFKETVADVLCLDPADFDAGHRLAEMGCDSLDVLDILYRLEMKLNAPGYGFRGRLDFDPLKEPLARLEQHVRSSFHAE